MIDEIRPIKERPSALTLVLFGLLAWLCAMLQIGFFNRLPLLGAAVPLALVVSATVGWRRGAATGAVFGLVAGVTLDALSSTAVSLSPLLLLATAVYMGRAAKRLFDHPLTLALASLPAYAVFALLQGILQSSVRVGLGTLLGALLATAVLLLPPIVRRLRRR